MILRKVLSFAKALSKFQLSMRKYFGKSQEMNPIDMPNIHYIQLILDINADLTGGRDDTIRQPFNLMTFALCRIYGNVTS